MGISKIKWFLSLSAIIFAISSIYPSIMHGQTGSWRLWAEGLPSGVYPRMTVAPNHNIYYTLLGTGLKLGYVYQANTKSIQGNFTELPQIPRPMSIQNNIVGLGYNLLSEPLVGIFRTDVSEPWIFRYDQNSSQWQAATSDVVPTLGGFCFATSPTGAIYAGTRWAYIYKSLDNGNTFQAINESKSIKDSYPCYYPSLLNQSESDGAIFSLSIDHRGRIYAGTETAGVIYSDDEGRSWHPADLYACDSFDRNKQDQMSPLTSLSKSGNVGSIGFTLDDKVIWSGADMWSLGWKNKMGFANLTNGTALPLSGLPDYLVQSGQQVSRIVTTSLGQIFFHSGGNPGSPGVGIYTSFDGINWVPFNTGISGQNDGLSQGSLAVDGNKVFMATRDGKVWIYEQPLTSIFPVEEDELNWEVFPNPAKDHLLIRVQPVQGSYKIILSDIFGKCLIQEMTQGRSEITLNVSNLNSGFYILQLDRQLKSVYIMN